MTDNDLDQIKTRRRLARDEVIAICEGKQWRMCIPVEQTDSDICITNSLDDIDALVAEVRRMQDQIDSHAEISRRTGETIIRLNRMIADLRGAMNADDERLRIAGERVGIIVGCDTADWMADEIVRLRSDVAQIGHERDLMVAANVEIQERLSACISALEFGEFVMLNSQRYLPGATGIERDAGKFLDRCEALLHAQDNK